MEPAPKEAPSAAWLRLVAGKVSGPRIPGKCVCVEKVLEDGKSFNPWAYGHFHWCPIFASVCDDCSMSSGTHTRDCPFWEKYPNITPF